MTLNHNILNFNYVTFPLLSGKEKALLLPPPLRTDRASFPAVGSSLSKPFDESQRYSIHNALVYDN